MTFETAGLGEKILKAINDLGFENPTPIQEKSIPTILETNNDVIALAQTGTGKTAAFGLPLLELVDSSEQKPQVLALCPTRELCVQISRDLETFAKYLKDVKIVSVYGGANIVPQIKALKKGCQIVVATPGRALDLIKRKALNVGVIKWLVMDEADEMLDRGFLDDLNSILAETPEDKRTFLFSATMPPEIASIAKNYMSSPIELTVGKKNSGAESISHQYYMVQARDRYNALKRIVDVNPQIYGIVFCRTRKETKDVSEKLIADGYNADALHGDLSQAQRDYVMNRFRKRHLQLLVATDVAARGLDVNDLTHVINYNLPDDPEVYIHRSGRTGRAGKSGVSIVIVHSRENRKLKDIERISKKKFERQMVPNGHEICEKQLFNLIDRLEKVDINEGQINQYLEPIYSKLEWLSKEDLIKHLVSVEFNRFLTYYENAPDINIKEGSTTSRRDRDRDGGRGRDRDRGRGRDRDRSARGGRRRSDRGGRDVDSNQSRFFINVGKLDGVEVTGLIGLINEYTKNRKMPLGKIDIMKKFSFFETDKSFEKEVLSSFDDASYNGRRVSVELSKPRSKK